VKSPQSWLCVRRQEERASNEHEWGNRRSVPTVGKRDAQQEKGKGKERPGSANPGTRQGRRAPTCSSARHLLARGLPREGQTPSSARRWGVPARGRGAQPGAVRTRSAAGMKAGSRSPNKGTVPAARTQLRSDRGAHRRVPPLPPRAALRSRTERLSRRRSPAPPASPRAAAVGAPPRKPDPAAPPARGAAPHSSPDGDSRPRGASRVRRLRGGSLRAAGRRAALRRVPGRAASAAPARTTNSGRRRPRHGPAPSRTGGRCVPARRGRPLGRGGEGAERGRGRTPGPPQGKTTRPGMHRARRAAPGFQVSARKVMVFFRPREKSSPGV